MTSSNLPLNANGFLLLKIIGTVLFVAITALKMQTSKAAELSFGSASHLFGGLPPV
jgi:hypothetical protein